VTMVKIFALGISMDPKHSGAEHGNKEKYGRSAQQTLQNYVYA